MKQTKKSLCAIRSAMTFHAFALEKLELGEMDTYKIYCSIRDEHLSKIGINSWSELVLITSPLINRAK